MNTSHALVVATLLRTGAACTASDKPQSSAVQNKIALGRCRPHRV